MGQRECEGSRFVSNAGAVVVVEDHQDPLGEGSLLAEPNLIAKTVARGVCVLPVEPFAYLHFSLGGYVRRGWGRDGWRFSRGAGERGCPMLIQIGEGTSYLHWAARVVGRGLSPSLSSLRLIVDTSNPAAVTVGLTPVEECPAFVPDEFRGTSYGIRIARGVSSCQSLSPGFLALSLYAVARDVSVLWSAVSVVSVSR